MDLCDAYQIFGEIRIRKHLTEKNHKKKHAVKLAWVDLSLWEVFPGRKTRGQTLDLCYSWYMAQLNRTRNLKKQIKTKTNIRCE